MNWFDSPPCARMDVARSSDSLVALKGPSAGSRVMGGATAAFGGVFATMGAGFLRAPIPFPFKLIPLAFTAIGAGIAAVGTSAALSECSVEAERGRGLTIRWKLPLRDERSLVIAAAQLEAFEVTSHAHRHSDDTFGDQSPLGAVSTVMEYRLVAVTKDGKATELESFGTHAQAKLRKAAFERVLFS